LVRSHAIGFVLLLLISRGTLLGQASTQPDADHEAVAKRLERLNRVRVQYNLAYHQRADWKKVPLPKAALPFPDNYENRVTFTYYNGFARWDTVTSESTHKWAAKNHLAMEDLLSETNDGDQRQELKQEGGQWVGVIWAGRRPRWWPLELGLGLLIEGTIDGPQWLTPSLLAKMEGRVTNSGHYILAYHDTTGLHYEWEFDRKNAYALVGYTRSFAKELIVRVTPTEFRDVDGLMLPFKIQMDNFDHNGIVSTNYTATISKYDLRVERAPVIIFPVGTTVLDTRTGINATIK